LNNVISHRFLQNECVPNLIIQPANHTGSVLA
ncbi:MAG: hypothetical protein ACI90A_000558, partial [Shewanella sp.]